MGVNPKEKYPVATRFGEISKEHNAIVGFLDWLGDKKGIELAEQGEGCNAGLESVYTPSQTLVAEFYGIDLKKLEEERRMMLDALCA